MTQSDPCNFNILGLSTDKTGKEWDPMPHTCSMCRNPVDRLDTGAARMLDRPERGGMSVVRVPIISRARARALDWLRPTDKGFTGPQIRWGLEWRIGDGAERQRQSMSPDLYF